MDPTFNSQLDALVAASGGLLRRGGGDRDINAQIALRKKNGCPDIWTSPASSCRVPTAIPGRSMHNHGFAEDIIDASTGRAVQAGSAADKWLAANAGRFGVIRPVGTPGKKGWEPWHLEPADRKGINGVAGLRDPNSIGFDLQRQNAAGTPRDELAYRLDTIGQILMGGAPEMPEPAQMPAPAEMPSPDQMQRPPSTPELGTDTTTVPGGTPAPAAGGGGDIKGMVRAMAAQMGWGDDQWPALERLVQKESSWNPRADNPTSTAYGLFQFLAQTWKNYGASQTDDPSIQAQLGLRYIKDRYGSPAAALEFHNRRGWY